MKFSSRQRRFDENRPEMMDVPDAEPDLLRQDLRHLRAINRMFGGRRALRRGIMPLIARMNGQHIVSILDLATGSGDQPIALIKKIGKNGYRLKITAVDRNPRMLDEARKLAAGIDDIIFEQCDITRLPYAAGSFDIVTCSLAIHHLSRENAVALLREMNRIAKVGFVVNDLSRSTLGAAVAWVYTRLATRNPITRNDTVLSIQRAFTKSELQSMVRDAGIQDAAIFTAPLFRLIIRGQQPCTPKILS